MNKLNRANSITDLIGNTPLFKPKKWLKSHGLEDANFYFKLESVNPTGSVKDRTALGMILDLEKRGLLTEESTIIEASSGNMGISLAAIAASRGYKAIFTMPESMSEERRKMLSSYGAKLVLTPADEGMQGAMEKAKDLEKEIDNGIIPSQFSNPANPDFHEKTTGPEIYKQSSGQVDVFLAGVGTGGTVTGIGRYLKSQNKDIDIFAVEPTESAVISGESSGSHGIQGIGAGFVPKNLDTSILTSVLQSKTEDAKARARELAETEGLAVGISSGAALDASLQLLEDEKYKDKTIITLLPDSGDRYLSTDLFKVNEY